MDSAWIIMVALNISWWLLACSCVDSKLEVSLPDIDYIEIPATWWDKDADKSLLIGVHKHGKK